MATMRQAHRAAQAKFVICEQSIDTNHGYARRPVVNSEAVRRRSTLERKLARVQRVAQQARERLQRALECARWLEQQIKAKRARATQRITEHLHEWEHQGMWSFRLA